jgi:methionyl-tRNA formyltransferase
VRVFIVTQDEPVYAPAYLESILAASRHEFVGVAALSAGGRHGFLALVMERRRMYGTADFVRAGLLFVRARFSRSVSRVAAARGVPLVPCTDVNAPAFVAKIRDERVDVLVSIAANQRFGEDLLAAPRVAAINLHSALLPKYRGLDGLFWAMVHGETTVGVTAHLMTTGIDEGSILGQAPFPVPPDATLHEMYLEAIRQGSALLVRVLDDLEMGTATAGANDDAAGSYFSSPTPEAVREFRRRGKRFFR